jgi:hypothetical protein
VLDGLHAGGYARDSRPLDKLGGSLLVDLVRVHGRAAARTVEDDAVVAGKRGLGQTLLESASPPAVGT